MPSARPGKPGSFWTDGVDAPSYPALSGDRSVDVAVIGGGIVGLTAALLLRRAGRSVAVLEARRVARQVSGRTTAKVTSQHNVIYGELAKAYGEDAARAYGRSNEAALARVADFVRDLGLACDFERRSAYVYTERAESVDRLREEAETAARLGLPARFTTEPPLGWPVRGAVAFDGQAQFHPYLYLLGLARAFVGDGGEIHEDTRVLDVDEGEPCTVVTETGIVTARDVIVATNLPILDRGGYFARAFPRAHMVVAAPVDPARAPDGMFISADQPSRSVRTAWKDGRLHLVASGQPFKTGERPDTLALAQEVADFVRDRFGVGAVGWHWFNQDYDSMDRLPFVGPLTPISAHAFTATGFGAWGMTNGTLAAMILSDRILGRANPWAELYDPARVNPHVAAGRFTEENLKVARHFVADRLARHARDLDDVAPGTGRIVQAGGELVAASRDASGALHLRSAVCTHMGCIVHWNTAAESWDCPCHGSRFEPDGRVIHGPAVRPLPERTLPDDTPGEDEDRGGTRA